MNHSTIKFVIIGYIVLTFIRPVIAESNQADDVSGRKINAVAGFNDTIFAGTTQGLFVSFNNGEEWKLSEFCGKNVSALEFDGENLYTGVEYFIYRSSDKTKTWSKMEKSQDLQSCVYILSLLKHQNNLFVGLDGCNPIILTENDTAMKAITLNNEDITGFQFLSKDSLLFIASNDLFRSSDNGITLQKITPASLTDSVVTFKFLTKSENAIFASCNKGIFRSTDDGNSWINCTPAEFSYSDDRSYTPVAVSGKVLLAGVSPHGIIRSTDNGNTWLVTDSGPKGNITFITATGTAVFAGTNDNGIFRSNDSGKTWQCVNNDLVTTKTTPVQMFIINNNFILKTIHQSTIVSITLTQPQIIEADILDLSGKRVANLAHTYLPVGSHQFKWNYNREKSGCYVLRLRIGDAVYTNSILRL